MRRHCWSRACRSPRGVSPASSASASIAHARRRASRYPTGRLADGAGARGRRARHCSSAWRRDSTRRWANGARARGSRTSVGLARPRGRIWAGRSASKTPAGGARASSRGLTLAAVCCFAGSAGSKAIETADLWILPASDGPPLAGASASLAREGRTWMTDESELVFAAARRPRRNRNELRALRLRPGEGAQVADGRSRRRLRGRRTAGRRSHHARRRLHRKAKKDLVGIVITHAHEDHIGALAELWPALGAPVYATRLRGGPRRGAAAGRAGRAEDSDPDRRAGRARRDRPVRRRVHRGRPFDPAKARALAIRTPAGLVVHTGDWKIDPTPVVGPPTDEARLRALGDEGVLALVCEFDQCAARGRKPVRARRRRDARRPGRARRRAGWSSPHSPPTSRACARPPRRASPPAGRSAFSGARWSASIAVARECGMLDGVPQFLGMDAFERLPRDKILALATGSQGEPRAALARMAEDEHPTAELSRRRHGDLLLAHHSRQREGGRQDHQRLRDRPASKSSPTATRWCMSPAIRAGRKWRRCTRGSGRRIAVPAHGEPLHLSEHAAFARAQGVPRGDARLQRRSRALCARRPSRPSARSTAAGG